jgi:hypothetical protein
MNNERDSARQRAEAWVESPSELGPAARQGVETKLADGVRAVLVAPANRLLLP